MKHVLFQLWYCLDAAGDEIREKAWFLLVFSSHDIHYFHRKLSPLHPFPLPTTSFLAICVANYRMFFLYEE